MNYEEMSDNELNFEVARHSFDAGWLERHYGKEGMVPDYCNSQSDAWPIITENRINIHFDWDEQNTATAFNKNSPGWYDKNPLRAAMIVFLMMKDAEK